MENNTTLRKYLFEHRLELYEEINELKDKVISGTHSERDKRNLEIAESNLNLITDIITICSRRNKY